jgi:hypothetical protein
MPVNTPRAAHSFNHLLQQHCVVAFKRLEDVMVTTQLPQPVDGCIAVAPTRLATHRQRVLSEGGGVCLEPSTAARRPWTPDLNLYSNLKHTGDVSSKGKHAMVCGLQEMTSPESRGLIGVTVRGCALHAAVHVDQASIVDSIHPPNPPRASAAIYFWLLYK